MSKQRVTEVYVWVVDYPDGEPNGLGEGILSAQFMGLGTIPLVTQSEHIARGPFRIAAAAAGKFLGKEVRLAIFGRPASEYVERIQP